MIYEIQSKSDFLTGAALVVKIPEDKLDKKALYTIQADEPEFILPFRHRNIDGQTELVYQIGAYCKLQYLAGGRSPKEYAQLWSSVLRPLLDCGDWFMKPYSFVLNAEYIYCDKNKKTVRYVYIPSVCECSDYDALKEMAADVTKLISVADTDLENKVLRAIMKDFDPNGFLQMLKSYIEMSAPVSASCYVTGKTASQTEYGFQITQPANTNQAEQPAQNRDRDQPREGGQSGSRDIAVQIPTGEPEPQERFYAPGDIVINFPADGAAARKSALSRKKSEDNGEKKEREITKPKIIGRLFSRKKEARQETIADNTAVLPNINEPAAVQPQPVFAPAAEHNDDTQSFAYTTAGTRLRLVGSVLLPPFIDVRISRGEVFTVGRFDAAVGRQQSSFEFDKKTKAVSRRHAAIERSVDSYSIIDLSSSAGTFINGQKLPPNTPYELGHGCRVSFGNAGADYVWEG